MSVTLTFSTGSGFFFRKQGLILSEIFYIWKGARTLKKCFIIVKKFHVPESVKTRFLIK